MGYLIIVLILIVSVLLAAVVLVQNSKGGGLATGFQGASQIGGVQKTADFLEKSTWYLTIALFVLCIVSASFVGNSAKTEGGYQEETSLPADPGVTSEDAGAPSADAPAE